MNDLLDGMKSRTVAANASADDNEVIVERLGRAAIGGQRGGEWRKNSATREANSARLASDSEKLSSKAAEAEVAGRRG